MANTPYHLLTSSMEIYTATWAAGVDGVPIGTFPGTASATVMCMVQPGSASDALVYGRDTTTKMFDVYCAPVTTAGASWTVTPKDKLIISGVQYRVAGQPRNLVNFGTVYVITLERDQD